MTREPDLEGEFYCPTCSKVRRCVLRKVSSVLTEHSAALWDSDLGSYVECLHCGDAFHPSVLNSMAPLTERDHAAFRTLMVGIMVSMMDIDGTADPAELDAVKAIFEELAGGPVTDSVLERGIELARVAGSEGAIALAREFNPMLNQLSRELVFRSALYISAADHALQQEEMDYLKRIGESLGLDAEHMGAIIRSAREQGHVSLGGSA